MISIAWAFAVCKVSEFVIMVVFIIVIFIGFNCTVNPKANAKEVEALELLKGCASKLGLEENDPVVMSSPQGFIDFVSCDGTSLAVLREGKYAPGVRETLIICARELDKL